MKKFLCFKWKEPFEKILDAILKAKNEKSKIEFSSSYLRSFLHKEQQSKKFINWVEENKEWLKPKMREETEFDRLLGKMPLGFTLEIREDIQLETLYIFDFR